MFCYCIFVKEKIPQQMMAKKRYIIGRLPMLQVGWVKLELTSSCLVVIRTLIFIIFDTVFKDIYIIHLIICIICMYI